MSEYYLQFYGNTFENVQEMGYFLAKYKLPKLTQKEVENPTSYLRRNQKAIRFTIEKGIKIRWFHEEALFKL